MASSDPVPFTKPLTCFVDTTVEQVDRIVVVDIGTFIISVINFGMFRKWLAMVVTEESGQ